MRHLKPEELIDLAEGARVRATAPHLDECEACRRELAACESSIRAAASFDVPEPSPLFWDHLLRRVAEAVAAEGAPPASWLPSLTLWSWSTIALSSAGALMALLLVVALTMRGSVRNGTLVSTPQVASGGAESEPLSDDPAALGLVGELTADADWDTVERAGLTPDGGADHAVTHLSTGELRELDRILKEALAKPGA
jgi:hypothetical protein